MLDRLKKYLITEKSRNSGNPRQIYCHLYERLWTSMDHSTVIAVQMCAVGLSLIRQWGFLIQGFSQCSWFLFHFTLRISGVYRFDSIWFHRKSCQFQFFSENTYFRSYVHNKFWATILYKYHAFPASLF